jgi:hypothetical protein
MVRQYTQIRPLAGISLNISFTRALGDRGATASDAAGSVRTARGLISAIFAVLR